MQTFDQALFGHVKAGRVTFEDAMRVASSPHDFKLLMQADGREGTTMEDVAAAESRPPETSPRPSSSHARRLARAAAPTARARPPRGEPAGGERCSHSEVAPPRPGQSLHLVK